MELWISLSVVENY